MTNSPLSGPLKGEKICVIGAGFVGSVAAAGFAKFGHDVVCVENDPEKLKLLREGNTPFFERDLKDLLREGLSCGRLTFSSDITESIKDRKAIFITVGTPSVDGGRADTSYILKAIADIVDHLEPDQTIVLKSTVPVGTAESIIEYLNSNGSMGKNIAVVNNPEFLREGSAVYDFFNPHRIVIGGSSHDSVETIAGIYRMGMTNPVPMITTNNQTAEMIKYASNVFLATKVGFVNELTRLCDSVGINAIEVARVMGMDPRIGQEFLNPGPGWGGSCLPKDLSEFMGLAKSLGISLLIPHAVEEANRHQYDHVINKIKTLVGDLENKKIGVLGLAFKANTSDLRDSPAIPIIDKLIELGASVKAFDPAAGEEAKQVLSGIDVVKTAYETAEDADCVLILTEWSEFQLLDWRKIGESMKNKNIVDTRNILTPESMKRYGFNYLSMGQN
jgi:UDPglucose 6-dehydrogenase